MHAIVYNLLVAETFAQKSYVGCYLGHATAVVCALRVHVLSHVHVSHLNASQSHLKTGIAS